MFTAAAESARHRLKACAAAVNGVATASECAPRLYAKGATGGSVICLNEGKSGGAFAEFGWNRRLSGPAPFWGGALFIFRIE